MIGLSNPKFRSRLASLSRLSYIVVAFAAAFVGLTLAGAISALSSTLRTRHPSASTKRSPIQRKRFTLLPPTFLCPDVRWPGMKRGAELSKAHANLSRRIRASSSPVVAWPGDTVEFSARRWSLSTAITHQFSHD